VLDDHRGRVDAAGHTLEMTITAVADEVAAAAELVKGKLAGVPVALVRGLADHVTEDDGPGARAAVRPAQEDLFRLGTDEALTQGRREAAAAGARCATSPARPWIPMRSGGPSPPPSPPRARTAPRHGA
jgi:coenzyme F420-0:L-glutamate ligase/coenzyme F420-1:gamma-L-glutamate ligase